MRTLRARSRGEWRRWLDKHHGSVPEVWLVFDKRHTGKTSLSYDDAVEEAICFGWIDSLVKRLDDDRYVRKFTPRKADSRWSAANRRRYADLEARGLLAAPGRERPPADRGCEVPSTPGDEIPAYIEEALSAHPRARAHFDRLAPSYRRTYVLWIDSAKRDETKQRRLREALTLLAAGKKLGLK